MSKVADGQYQFDNDLNSVIDAMAGNGVISGLAVTEKGAGADMSVDVALGVYVANGTKVTKSSTTNVVIQAADALPRKDIIVGDSSGNITAVKGTAVAAAPVGSTGPQTYTPAPPDIPSNKILLAEVWVAASAATVVNANITDRRITIFGALYLEELPNRNAIINGAGLVDQRQADYTLVKDTYGVRADRWYGMATGTAVSAGVLSVTPSPLAGIYGNTIFFLVVTITGAGEIHLRYRMEAKDALRFVNRTASFSCKAWQNTGGAVNYTVYIRKPTTTADDFSGVTAISNSGAISVPDSTLTNVNYLAIALGDCSKGIEIEIKVECGAVIGKYFDFGNFQFEFGSVATPFEFRYYQQELALCQRYYEKSYDSAIAPGASSTAGAVILTSRKADAWDRLHVSYKVPKRTTPTITVYSTTGASAKWRDLLAAADLAAAASYIGDKGFFSYPTAPTTIDYLYGFHWTALSEL